MSNIKAGGVFVEIGADPRQFFRTLNRVNKAMANMGRSLASAGAKVGGMGVATLAPFAAAVRAGAGYQTTLLNIQASTGATAAELDRLKAASMEMSAAMGRGPTEVAGAFLELLKAGMSVEQVLGGAGKAAIEFAAVGQMDVADAAVVMADAMNVFGVDASKAANSISAAADASSTSIELMAQSFAQVSAVAALANQSIDQTSAALAILANNGVKGSDAGTSVKTMLMRLMAPADDAVTALGQLGLSVQSFRNADGTMKPLVDIIGVLNGALGNMDQAAKDDIFRRIFGQDAIRAAAILTSAGVDGFNAMTTSMGEALPVGEKYKTLMSGLSGAGQQVMSAMQRFAIAVSDAVGPALMSVVTPLMGLINGLTEFARNNQETVATIMKFGVAAIAIGGALTGLGLSIQAVSFAFGGVLKAMSGIAAVSKIFGILAGVVGLVASPIGLVVAGIAALIAFGPMIADKIGGPLSFVGDVFRAVQDTIGSVAAGMMTLFSDLGGLASTTFKGIFDAIATGDLSGAMEVAWAGMEAIWRRGTQSLVNTWYTAIGEIKKLFVTIGSAWDTYVTKPISMFGVRVAESGQERAILGAFDTTQGTIFDNASKKAARERYRAAEQLLESSSIEGFQANKDRAKGIMASLRETVNAGMADGATAEQQQAGQAAAKEIAAYEDAIRLVQARFRQLGIKTPDERQADIDKAQAEIDAATKAAIDANNASVADSQGRLNAAARSKSDQRGFGEQYARLLEDIQNASSISQLQDYYGEFDALMSNGKLSSAQIATMEAALEDAQERVSKGMSTMGGPANRTAENAAAGGAGSQAANQTQAQTVGTFSSVGLGGLGFGASLAQKQLDTLKKIEENTREGNDGAVQE